jgi:hypothetical protein
MPVQLLLRRCAQAYLIVATFSMCTAVGASELAQMAAPETIKDAQGDTFMQEIPSDKPAQNQAVKPKLVPDLRTMDIPVDPNGNIVPLKIPGTNGVLPFYSQIEQTVEPLYQPVPFYAYPAYPYGGYMVPGVAPYGNYPFGSGIVLNIGRGRFNIGIGPGAMPYPARPYWNSPVSPWLAPPVVSPAVPYPYSPAYPLF